MTNWKIKSGFGGERMIVRVQQKEKEREREKGGERRGE